MVSMQWYHVNHGLMSMHYICDCVCLCGWNHTESRWMVTQDLFTGACHRQTGTNTTKSWLKDSAPTFLKVLNEINRDTEFISRLHTHTSFYQSQITHICLD